MPQRKRPIPKKTGTLRWGGRWWDPNDMPQFRQWLGRHGITVKGFKKRQPTAWKRLQPGYTAPTPKPGLPAPGQTPPITPPLPDPTRLPVPETRPGTPLPGETPPIVPPPTTPLPDTRAAVNPEVPLEPPATPTTTPPVAGPLSANPQLTAAPLGAYTDAEYEAQRALLERNIRQEYSGILRQLGFNQDGQYIPGEVETQATAQRTDLQRGMGLAGKTARQQGQQEGNLWSGYFAQNLADQTEPFVRGLADLEIATPRQLADLRQQALGILSGYDLEHYALLADAAQRRAAMLGMGMGGEV